ncbi:hypothetical protein IFM89_006733 [Coptis chinensis]|uniref:RanBP2-type domain-containing protein n=1 Tax=Coptis chinensis TaxID=261450 RepID=A0A835LYT9_9MAGN|nr:hypothetical protein IFM89_006733 [Coptis chinensis]
MGEGREGDWECGSCTNRNYAFRSFCNHLLDASFCTPLGGVNFMGTTGDTLEYIVKQSNVLVDNLRNVSDYLSQLKRVGVVRFFLGHDVGQRLILLNYMCSFEETMPYPDSFFVMLLLTFLGLRPPLYYNRSGPLGSHTLQPFSCGLGDRSCASGEVEFSNATQKSQRIIALKVKRYSKWIYGIGDGFSCGDALFDLRVIYARERRHRVYTKHLILRLWSGSF